MKVYKATDKDGKCRGVQYEIGKPVEAEGPLILCKNGLNELRSYVHPRSVRKLKMDGKTLDDGISRSVGVYFFIYALVFTVSILILCRDGMNFSTNFTAVAACINNIGPGLDVVGPAGNYAAFSPLSKIVLIFDMLAGRLELFPILVLFAPIAWKKN